MVPAFVARYFSDKDTQETDNNANTLERDQTQGFMRPKNSTIELHQRSLLVRNVSLKQAEACKLHGTVSSRFHRPHPVDCYSAEHSRQCGQPRQATFGGTSTRPYVLCIPEKTQSV